MLDHLLEPPVEIDDPFEGMTDREIDRMLTDLAEKYLDLGVYS